MVQFKIWFLLIVVTFQIQRFDTSMILKERVVGKTVKLQKFIFTAFQLGMVEKSVHFFSRGRAFACGMRETFEPEIVIEDVPYETFYALLEFHG